MDNVSELDLTELTLTELIAFRELQNAKVVDAQQNVSNLATQRTCDKCEYERAERNSKINKLIKELDDKFCIALDLTT